MSSRGIEDQQMFAGKSINFWIYCHIYIFFSLLLQNVFKNFDNFVYLNFKILVYYVYFFGYVDYN